MVDARRHPRYRVKVPVYISLGGGTYRKTIHLESRDVSASGLSFETSRAIPIDAESRIVIARLGDLQRPALIHGRIAYRMKDPDSGRYTVGLEFTRFENTTREELLAHLESWTGATPVPTPE
jgi:c-di-GMP-binding flagellar brake protein YcgR